MQIVLCDGGTRILGTYVSKGFTTVGSVYLLLGAFKCHFQFALTVKQFHRTEGISLRDAPSKVNEDTRIIVYMCVRCYQ